jgi:hypothetical protein
MCFVLFLPEQVALVETLLSQACKSQGWVLSRTRSTVLDAERLKSLFSWTSKEKLEKQCQGREIIGIEICGQGIRAEVEATLNAVPNSKGHRGFRIVPENMHGALGKAFFEVWKDEI